MRQLALLSPASSNVAIVNSCAVTAESVRQTHQAIRRLSRTQPDREIIVTGCAAQIDPDPFALLPNVTPVSPNHVKTLPESWGLPKEPPRPPVAPSTTHTRAFVDIQNGCNHRCTFCTIPLGRGVSRSRTILSILTDIRAHVEQGVCDVILTGVDLTSWGADLSGEPKLGDLVRTILLQIPDL